jgi:hypothetical protein
VRRFFRAKAQRFDANGGDACGCRNPLGGVVVGTFYTLGLRVKTLDFGLDDGGVTRRYLLGGIVAEFRLLLVVLCLRWRVWFSCTFCLSLICRVRGSPHHLVSVRPYVALFIKRGESLFPGTFALYTDC